MRPSLRSVTVLLACSSLSCAILGSTTDVGRLMQTIDPAARAIWASVATSVTADGIKETFPRNDAEWNELRKAASALGDAGARLKKDSRAEGNSEWMRWSQALVDAAAGTLKGVDARSPEQLLSAGEQIYNTCVGCHGRYSTMTPPP